MKKLLFAAFAVIGANTFAQSVFERMVETDWQATEVVVPPSPFDFQVIFVGGEDMVQTNRDEEVPAKQWHDFIGLTPITEEDCVDDPNAIGWISINHERILSDDKIGDGGGMTSFLLARDPGDESLYVIPQTLADGRSGEFFNVDFSGVGETGMNCGGINSIVDGRIWTAEEWFRTSNASIYQEGAGVRDTVPYTIKYTSFEMANWQTIPKYENFNWMVEIDPREAKAIRKQYNWGRQPFEGGAVAADNQTVYMGADATPGFFTRFTADEPGDFTSGTLEVYKHDDPNRWVEIDNEDFDKMLNFSSEAVSAGATMFNRLEWVTINANNGKIYMTETGRDTPASSWEDEFAAGAVFAPHHLERAATQGVADPTDAEYWDYYGRVLEYDPATGDTRVYIEGGPFFEESPALADYPIKHLSNPDGLNVLYTTVDNEERTFLLVQEDLNGTSFGRAPAEFPDNRMCELYLLDLEIENPVLDDLIRLTQTPLGAEITGAVGTPDGKSILVNSQHPSTSNPAPFNNSLTYALTGFDRPGAIDALLSTRDVEFDDSEFNIYPNPAERIVYFNQTTDVALYDILGKRIGVYRNVSAIDIFNLSKGTYLLKTKEGETRKLIIK